MKSLLLWDKDAEIFFVDDKFLDLELCIAGDPKKSRMNVWFLLSIDAGGQFFHCGNRNIFQFVKRIFFLEKSGQFCQKNRIQPGRAEKKQRACGNISNNKSCRESQNNFYKLRSVGIHMFKGTSLIRRNYV